MSPRRRQAKPLKRIAGRRPEYRTIIVFTEGKKSEPDYINGLKGLSHIAEDVSLNLELHPEHGVPKTLVELAVERNKDDEVDECWCIFDVEWPKNHPNLKEAVALAQSKGIKLAISNPCFEVWLVLHFRDFDKFCNTDAVESQSRQLDKRAGKGIDTSIYMEKRKIAARRAQILQTRHERNGTLFPHDNPSSGMYLFLQSLEGNSWANSI